jgi:prepilin-type N-terminal cleavage/methylation domain-containing protein
MTTARIFPSRRREDGGFTLIEMLVVIGVILILVSIGVPNFLNSLRRAKISDAKVRLMNVKAAVTQYHQDTRQYPESGSWHVYYVLTGQLPFDANRSKRYKPPYTEFPPSDVGRPVGTSQDYKDVYDSNTDIQISMAASPDQDPAPVASSELFPQINSDYSGGSNPLRFYPLIDPWERPIVYISPDDLKDAFENTADRDTRWDAFMAWSEQIRANKNQEERAVPFDMESGQFWSAGPDGVTARGDGGGNASLRGLFQPGNVTFDDGRDNDLDEQSDVSDPKPNGDNPFGEDDINSWS